MVEGLDKYILGMVLGYPQSLFDKRGVLSGNPHHLEKCHEEELLDIAPYGPNNSQKRCPWCNGYRPRCYKRELLGMAPYKTNRLGDKY